MLEKLTKANQVLPRRITATVDDIWIIATRETDNKPETSPCLFLEGHHQEVLLSHDAQSPTTFLRCGFGNPSSA